MSTYIYILVILITLWILVRERKTNFSNDSPSDFNSQKTSFDYIYDTIEPVYVKV